MSISTSVQRLWIAYASVAILSGLFSSAVNAQPKKEDPPPWPARQLASQLPRERNQYSTVTFVKHNDGYYIVGAYHSLFKAGAATISLPILVDSLNLDPSHSDSKTPKVDKIFFDRLEDIFIAKLDDKFINDELNLNLRNWLTEHAWPLATVNPLAATSAFAVGNPTEVIIGAVSFQPENIAYHCTISEYGPAEKRIQKLIVRAGNRPKILKDANELPRMFVETLSINKGFSGGPVLDPDKDKRKIFGIIVAGTEKMAPGRFAVVCPADRVANLINTYSDPKIPKTEYQREINKLDTVNWEEPNYAPLYDLSQFGPYGEVVIGNQSGRTDINPFNYEKYKEVLQGPQLDNRIVFLNCNFRNVDFGEVLLGFVAFRNCTFGFRKDDEPFAKAVVTGCSFENCQFTRSPKEYFVGKESIRDINNEDIPRQKEIEDEPGVAPEKDTMTKESPKAVPTNAAQGKLDALSLQTRREKLNARREKLAKVLEPIRQPNNSDPSNATPNAGYLNKVVPPQQVRYALVLAQLDLAIASTYLQAPNGSQNLVDAMKSIKQADTDLLRLDEAIFGSHEAQVYQKISAEHRALVAQWLAATRTVSGLPTTTSANTPSGPPTTTSANTPSGPTTTSANTPSGPPTTMSANAPGGSQATTSANAPGGSRATTSANAPDGAQTTTSASIPNGPVDYWRIYPQVIPDLAFPINGNSGGWTVVRPPSASLTGAPSTVSFSFPRSDNEAGLGIVEVRSGSIAQQARLETGDVILAAGPTRTQTLAELQQALASTTSSLELTVRRGATKKIEKVVLTPVAGKIGVAVTPIVSP